MRTTFPDPALPTRRVESFTAQTLRLRVRAADPEPVVDVDAPAVVVEHDHPPAQTQPGTLVVRLEAERALSFAPTGDEPPSRFGPHDAPRFGIAGTVEAIAGSAPGFDVGHPVFGVTSTRPFDGAHRLVIAEACRMARMPCRLDFAEAAASALAGTAARQMLFKIGRIEAGETVLVLGADTPTGAFAVQLAALHGVRAIAMARSRANEAELLAHGAHFVIDEGPGALEAQCRVASLVVDALGGEPHRRAAGALQSGCTLVSCSERPDVFTAARRRTRSLFCVPESTTACLARIATLIDGGFIKTGAIAGHPAHD